MTNHQGNSIGIASMSIIIIFIMILMMFSSCISILSSSANSDFTKGKYMFQYNEKYYKKQTNPNINK